MQLVARSGVALLELVSCRVSAASGELLRAVSGAFRRRFTGAGELHRVGAASGELLRAVSGVLVPLYWSW